MLSLLLSCFKWLSYWLSDSLQLRLSRLSIPLKILSEMKTQPAWIYSVLKIFYWPGSPLFMGGRNCSADNSSFHSPNSTPPPPKKKKTKEKKKEIPSSSKPVVKFHNWTFGLWQYNHPLSPLYATILFSTTMIYPALKVTTWYISQI